MRNCSCSGRDHGRTTRGKISSHPLGLDERTTRTMECPVCCVRKNSLVRTEKDRILLLRDLDWTVVDTRTSILLRFEVMYWMSTRSVGSALRVVMVYVARGSSTGSRRRVGTFGCPRRRLPRVVAVRTPSGACPRRRVVVGHELGAWGIKGEAPVSFLSDDTWWGTPPVFILAVLLTAPAAEGVGMVGQASPKRSTVREANRSQRGTSLILENIRHSRARGVGASPTRQERTSSTAPATSEIPGCRIRSSCHQEAARCSMHTTSGRCRSTTIRSSSP